MSNPWLSIPASDYEAHMSDTRVGQAQLLNSWLGEVIPEKNPESVLVLGSSSGNGFEHLITNKTRKVKAVDINPEYCKILESRFSGKIPGLEVVCTEISELQLPVATFDLVHCALIFEYVEVSGLLLKIRYALKPGGWMSVILQQPSQHLTAVTKTSFESLEKLSEIMHLIPADDFRNMAALADFRVFKEKEIILESGKKFYLAIFN